MDRWHHLALVLGQVGAMTAFHEMCGGLDYKTSEESARLDTGLSTGWLDDSWEAAYEDACAREARRNGCG